MLFQEDQRTAPQSVEVRVRCLRAVRDKLPRGPYSVSVSLHSRLGGPAVAQHNEPTQRQWSVVTEPAEHLGRYYSTDLNVNQSALLVRICLSVCLSLPISYLKALWTIPLSWKDSYESADPRFFFLQQVQYD